ncbi:MAG: CDP-diacylglycerol--glycerol-3-phosphate 3-phosphatidyltransferase [Lachnospiraceae bacterium]|nr:CDP-diacylglycerol--glycerol-3-phosphate 3-phosphatidyltransferase [Lachnospiraceae bacterium]
MNLPNKITVARFIMVPIFAVIFLIQLPWSNVVGLVVFLIACISDFFDGYLARKNNLVTDFGKLMDPLADKLLVCTALVCFIEVRDNFPAWCAILIIAREFIISGIRQLGAEKKIIIMASIWGKAKTVLQMITCILFILDYDHPAFTLAENIFMWLAAAMTVISLVDYIFKNRVIFEKASK